MFVDLTPEQHALRHKVRDYFQNLMTPELRQQMRGVARQIAMDPNDNMDL